MNIDRLMDRAENLGLNLKAYKNFKELAETVEVAEMFEMNEEKKEIKKLTILVPKSPLPSGVG